MNKKTFKILATAIFFIFYALLCVSQDCGAQINGLLQNPKIISPEIVLEDFIKGKQWTRVIVNLSKPMSFQQIGDFKNMTFRKNLQEAVKTAQDRVISHLDPNKVRIIGRFSYIFAFSAEVTLEGIKELTEIENVLAIEKDKLNQLFLSQGIPLMNASTVRNHYAGEGLAIAICDSGIDYTHPMLGGGGFPNSKVIGGYDTGENDSDPMPSSTFQGAAHGTCCAGIAAGDLGNTGDYIGGVAHNAKLYALKIENDSGGIWDKAIIDAWEWCITHQYDDLSHPIMIISNSNGGGIFDSVCDGERIALRDEAANVVAAGMALFAASGNQGFCKELISPACISHVISVGAVYDANIGSETDTCISQLSCIGYYHPGCPPDYWACDDSSTYADLVTCYSNSASFLDIFAPSNNAYTTDIVGYGGYNLGDYYPDFGGTSAACPYAAGAAACLQSAAKAINGTFLTPFEVRSLLTNTGDPVTDIKHGHISITKPRVNLAAAVDAIENVISLGEAMDNTSLVWATVGDAEWFGQTSVTYYDGDAAQSGSISDDQDSSIGTSVTGPGTLSFYWKVSSEIDYDFLKFSIDGVTYSQMSGEVDWHKVTYEIASGSYYLMWSYTKDGSNSEGSDAGWLDKVEFISGPANDCEGDFDGDGDVDGSDLATFAADFGRTDCE